MSQFKVDATIGTSEIVDALVHEAIKAMREEHAKVYKHSQDCEAEADRLRNEIGDLLLDNPPEEVKPLVEALLGTGIVNLNFVWVERDYSGYHEKIVTASSGLCWLSLEVDSPSRHNPPPFHASGQMRFSLLRTESPPSCIPAELIERLDKALLDGKKYTKMAYDLGSRLQCEQTLRTELRGEMLNKVLATQAPEIAKLFPDLVGAEVKALTVIEHEG